MGLFASKGRNHLEGFKELSKHSEIINIEAIDGFKVYFPTMSPNKKTIEYLVKPGDYVFEGQKIGYRTDFYVPIYSSVSGTVLENEKIFSAQIGTLIPHVVIESDGKHQLAEPLKTVTLNNTKEEIFEAIKESGMVGMGGAGFPTYIKYLTDKPIDTIIANGVECEPFLTTDFVSAIKEADELLGGLELLMKASGAKKAIIAIKVHKEEERDAINKFLPEHPNITLIELPDLYPMGWEKVLIEETLGRTYEKLPADCGCIVNNTQTIISLYKILTTGRPVTKRLVTVSGDAIRNPSNVYINIGTLADSLISACGGYLEAGEISLIPGGPMCSKAATNDAFPMLLQMGSLTILKYKKLRVDACLRCGSCTSHCPAHLQPVEIKRAFDSKNVDRMIALNTMACVECGTCSFVCPSHIELTDYIKKSKGLVRLRMPAPGQKK
jgi:electron transport complex protein RnfC